MAGGGGTTAGVEAMTNRVWAVPVSTLSDSVLHVAAGEELDADSRVKYLRSYTRSL